MGVEIEDAEPLEPRIAASARSMTWIGGPRDFMSAAEANGK